MREKNKAYTSCKVKLVIFYNNLFIEKLQFDLLTERKKNVFGVHNVSIYRVLRRVVSAPHEENSITFVIFLNFKYILKKTEDHVLCTRKVSSVLGNNFTRRTVVEFL